MVLGIDKAVARAWPRKEFASGEHAELAKEILELLPDGALFRTLFLYSEDNIADCPSRNDPILDEYARYHESRKILSGEYLYASFVRERVNGANRRAKMSIADLTSDELGRVSLGIERWTHHGTKVGTTQELEAEEEEEESKRDDSTYEHDMLAGCAVATPTIRTENTRGKRDRDSTHF